MTLAALGFAVFTAADPMRTTCVRVCVRAHRPVCCTHRCSSCSGCVLIDAGMTWTGAGGGASSLVSALLHRATERPAAARPGIASTFSLRPCALYSITLLRVHSHLTVFVKVFNCVGLTVLVRML